MSRGTELSLEAATGLIRGAREHQEDAVLCDVPRGGADGLMILADGLGGHAAGALASRIAVTTMLDLLAARRDAEGTLQGDVPAQLRSAAAAANRAVLSHAVADPAADGMGTTLLVAVVRPEGLYWLSIGDSPLYLVRGGRARQLNAVHSLASQLDLLVRAGELTAEDALQHPARNYLTSALGLAELGQIDCPDVPLPLEPEDVLLAASDGILTLEPHEIAKILGAGKEAGTADLASRLLEAVTARKADAQDNAAVAVLRIGSASVPRAVHTGASRIDWLAGLRGTVAAILGGSPVQAREARGR